MLIQNTVALTAASLIAGSTLAAPLTVVNHDFETDAVAEGVNGNFDPAGWTITHEGQRGVFNPNGTTQAHYGSDAQDSGGTGGEVGTMDGPGFAFFFHPDGDTSEASQVLAATLTANTTYTLTVAIGTRNYFNAGQVPSDFRIVLETTGGTVVAEFTGDVISGNSESTLNTTGTITPTENTFVDYSATGSTAGISPAGEGEQLVIKIQALADGRYLDFDNVRLDASAVPEPGSIALLGLGGLCMLRRRLR